MIFHPWITINIGVRLFLAAGVLFLFFRQPAYRQIENEIVEG